MYMYTNMNMCIYHMNESCHAHVHASCNIYASVSIMYE